MFTIMVNPLSITIQLVTYADMPALAQISGNSFEEDRHTVMKGQGKKPYNMYENAPTKLGRYLSSEKCVMLKAVDEATGTVVGFSCWGFRGFEVAEIPRLDPGQPRGNDMSKPVFKEEMVAKQQEEEEDSVKRLRL
jgi:hypothetical protein